MILFNLNYKSINIFFAAPRIKSDFGRIKWNKMSSNQVHNLARALKGLYPLQTTWKGNVVKLLEVFRCEENAVIDYCDNYRPGFVMYDKNEQTLKVLCADRKWVSVKKVGVVGKPVMSATDFNNGYVNKEDYNHRYFE